MASLSSQLSSQTVPSFPSRDSTTRPLCDSRPSSRTETVEAYESKDSKMCCCCCCCLQNKMKTNKVRQIALLIHLRYNKKITPCTSMFSLHAKVSFSVRLVKCDFYFTYFVFGFSEKMGLLFMLSVFFCG